MNEERNPLDLQSMPKGQGQDDRELEERLGVSFGSVRLLSDRDNPLSFEQARDRTRREAEIYFRWEASGAPLNDITVRLSDGEELTLAKRIAADLCGLRIVKKFLHGEVLHLYKKEDRRFGEVPLYSLEVAMIEGDQFTYTKTFPNKQTLTLECRRGAAGEFDVCVNYTPPVGEQAWGKTAGMVNAGAILGPALAPIGRLWNALRDRLRGDDGSARPGSVLANAVAALALFFASVTFYENYNANRSAGDRNGGGAAASQEGAAAAAAATTATAATAATTAPAEVLTAALKSSDESAAADGAAAQTAAAEASASAGDVARRGGRAPAAEVERVMHHNNGDTATVVADAGSSCNAFPAPAQAAVPANVTKLASARRHGAQKVRSGTGGGKVIAPPASSVAQGRIPIYVKASAPGDSKLAKELLDAFVAALQKTKRFEVWTDSPGVSVPRAVWEVSLDFERKEGCFGMIYTRFYDASGNPMGDDEKDCHEYPRATMLATTSDKIVNEILLPLIDEGKEVSRKG